jgi:hypothetical protein
MEFLANQLPAASSFHRVKHPAHHHIDDWALCSNQRNNRDTLRMVVVERDGEFSTTNIERYNRTISLLKLIPVLLHSLPDSLPSRGENRFD